MDEQTITFEATSRIVAAGDISLHLNEVGSGPPVVMLHGSGPGASSWSNFKQNLPSLSKHFRVLAVDQPGYGRSDKPHFSDTDSFLSVTSRALLALLDSLGIDKASFVGNSLGGASALKFALTYPDRTERLVLMGAGGAAVNIFSPPMSEGFRHLRAFFDRPGRDTLEAFLKILVFDPAMVTDELLDERYEAAMAPESLDGGVRVQASLDRLPEDDQLWRSLHKVRTPTLLTWGRDDRVIPLDCAFFALRRMPNAHLHVFPKCGHWAQLERLEEFDDLVITFLTSRPLAR